MSIDQTTLGTNADANDTEVRPAHDHTVDVTTTGTQGRFVNQAREQLLVADSTVGRGGRAEAWLAAEMLLAAIGTCASSSITFFAREGEHPLADVFVSVHADRQPGDHTRFKLITIEVSTYGIDRATAEELVRQFTATCPVYGTVSRGAEVAIEVVAHAA